jgi:hypothetical protein
MRDRSFVLIQQNHQYAPDLYRPSDLHGPSEPCSRAVRQTASDKNLALRLIEPRTRTDTWWTWWTQIRMDRPCLHDGPSVRYEQNPANLKSRGQLHLSIHLTLKRLNGLRQDFREMWSVPRGCYAQKLEVSNQLNRRELTTNRAQPKS